MIVCGTGHRPKDLPSKYIRNHPWKINKINLLMDWLRINTPKKVISGGALGWDQYLLWAAIKCGLYTSVYIPCENQDGRWPTEFQEIYKNLLSKSNEIKYIDKGPYAAYKMQKRNLSMLKDADLVLALWNPEKRYGGTWNCIQSGIEMNKKIINFWSDQPTQLN